MNIVLNRLFASITLIFSILTAPGSSFAQRNELGESAHPALNSLCKMELTRAIRNSKIHVWSDSDSVGGLGVVHQRRGELKCIGVHNLEFYYPPAHFSHLAGEPHNPELTYVGEFHYFVTSHFAKKNPRIGVTFDVENEGTNGVFGSRFKYAPNGVDHLLFGESSFATAKVNRTFGHDHRQIVSKTRNDWSRIWFELTKNAIASGEKTYRSKPSVWKETNGKLDETFRDKIKKEIAKINFKTEHPRADVLVNGFASYLVLDRIFYDALNDEAVLKLDEAGICLFCRLDLDGIQFKHFSVYAWVNGEVALKNGRVLSRLNFKLNPDTSNARYSRQFEAALNKAVENVSLSQLRLVESKLARKFQESNR